MNLLALTDTEIVEFIYQAKQPYQRIRGSLSYRILLDLVRSRLRTPTNLKNFTHQSNAESHMAVIGILTCETKELLYCIATSFSMRSTYIWRSKDDRMAAKRDLRYTKSRPWNICVLSSFSPHARSMCRTCGRHPVNFCNHGGLLC